MERKKKIEEEVERTLNVLGGIENVDVNPFLYTRVKAKLQEKESTENKPSGALVFKLGLIILLFAFNIFTIVNSESRADQVTSVTQQYLQELGNEYNLYESNYYSYNIE